MPNISTIEARKVIETYFTAFDARDIDALQNTLHFPHVRIDRQNRIRIIMNAYESKNFHEEVFKFMTERQGWDHSTLDVVEVIHKSDVKVHFKIEFSLYKADGVKYVTYKSLWIVSKKDYHWGVLARSNYA